MYRMENIVKTVYNNIKIGDKNDICKYNIFNLKKNSNGSKVHSMTFIFFQVSDFYFIFNAAFHHDGRKLY